MKRLPPWSWLAALAPAAVAGLVAAGLTLAVQPLPILRILIDVATLALVMGLAASAVLIGLLAALAWSNRRANRAITQAQQAAAAEAANDRRRFLQRLDHELKNPLTAIQAGLALIPAGGPTPAEAPAEPPTTALASVEAQVRRISRLTADLRKLAELESRPLERRPVDIAELLTQVVELAQERAEGNGRRLTLTLPQAPWPLPQVAGDYDLLLLVAHNLVDNATKYSRPGDTLEVRASEDGNWVVVEVADTGPGIPAAELPHVWEELYRGAGARGMPGSGLGLALAQAIVLRHGGQVALRSREGQGTVVQVRLPVR